MIRHPLPLARAGLVAAALLTLSIGACGRRGPLEPPPDPAAPAAPAAAAPASPGAKSTRAVPADRRLRPGAAQGSAAPTTLATQSGAVVEDSPDDDEDETETAFSVSPSPTPRKRGKAFVVPNESFVLDPLL